MRNEERRISFLMSHFSFCVMLALALIGIVIWAGQQRPPDRYLDDIRGRGTLRVGLDPTYPPFESLLGEQFVGRDIDLARAIATDLGVHVEFKPLALDTQYDALASGQVDVLISALPFIYERQKEVRYSQPYYQAGQVIVVRPGEDAIKSAADPSAGSGQALQGKRVGVELGSNADTEARRLARTTLTVMQLRSDYHSAAEALDALLRGDLDAAITDNTSAQEYLAAHSGALSMLSPTVTDEPFVVAMPVGAGGLAEHVNATIDRLRASGELARMMGMAGK
jgi:polar amino acid transport system substrate-binding protein